MYVTTSVTHVWLTVGMSYESNRLLTLEQAGHARQDVTERNRNAPFARTSILSVTIVVL